MDGAPGPKGDKGDKGDAGVPGVNGTNGANGFFSLVFNGGTNGGSLSSSSARYASLVAQTSPSSTSTNGNATVQSNGSGTLSGFAVSLSGAPQNGGGTQSYTVVVMVDGSPSSITCTISESATSCTDTTHSVVLVPGQTVNVRVTPAGSPNTASATWSATYANGSPIQ
jgi:hypothetical protein